MYCANQIAYCLHYLLATNTKVVKVFIKNNKISRIIEADYLLLLFFFLIIRRTTVLTRRKIT